MKIDLYELCSLIKQKTDDVKVAFNELTNCMELIVDGTPVLKQEIIKAR